MLMNPRVKNWSFFHNYYKSLYPKNYQDMIGQPPSPEPPTETPVVPLQKQRDRDEDPYDKAKQDAVRLQDRLSGKTTIQGQVVGQNIPEFISGQPGSSPVINSFMTGQNIESSSSMLSKTPTSMALNKLSEKAHKVNINALIESKGESGGVGMVWSPQRGWQSVSMSVSDLGETTSGIIQKLTGDSSGKRRTLNGNIPDVFVYKGQVYNLQNNKSRLKFLDNLQANAKEVYKNHIENTAVAEGVGFESDTITGREDTSSDWVGNVGGSQLDLGIYDEKTGTFSKASPSSYEGSLSAAQRSSYKTDVNIERTPEQEKQAETYKQEFKKEQEEQQKDTDGDKYTQVGEFEYNTGGFVDQNNPQTNLSQTGFIGGQTPDQVTDKQSVADNIPIQGNKGDYIVNAPAIENDPETFYEMLNKGLAEAGSQGINITDIPSDITQEGVGNILASAGEFKIEKPLAEIIGYDQLDMFNNAGKGEVQQRLAASGGFINGYANGGDVGTGYDDVPEEFYNKIKQFSKKKAQRPQIDKFLDGLTDEERLTLVFLTETEAGKDPIEHMQRIGDVVLNRVESDNDDFKDVNTILDVVKQRSPNRGDGTKMYQFDGLEPTSLHERLLDVTERGMKNSLKKAYSAALNTLDTEPDLEQYRLPKNVLFYQKLDPNEDNWMDNNPLLAPLHEFGEHVFYEWFPTADENLFPVREYP